MVINRHYDPDLHGLDWELVRLRYEQHLMQAESANHEIRLIDQMMQELGDSHCGLFSTADAQKASSPYLFGEGTPGIDIRIIESQAVITKVEENSSADQAGLRPGYVLVAVNDLPVTEIINDAVTRPPHTDANQKYFQTEAVLWALFGSAGTSVKVEYLDADEKLSAKSLQRLQRKGSVELAPSLPRVVLEHQQFMLPAGINYLAFNAFQPDQPSEILASIEKIDHSKPLIIDLRGNNGGSVNATIELLNQFSHERFLAFHRVGRREEVPYFVTPASRSQPSRIVILIDEMSVSAAENFTAVMQLNGMAEVVGVRTPGQLLWGESLILQTDLVAVIPTARIVYPNGSSIEGKGIMPDKIVQLSRDALLGGIDSQLGAAIELLQSL